MSSNFIRQCCPNTCDSGIGKTVVSQKEKKRKKKEQHHYWD